MSCQDDVIQVLKQSSRLFHYCATPLLLDPHWRLKVMEKYRATQTKTAAERQVSIVIQSRLFHYCAISLLLDPLEVKGHGEV